MGASLLVKLIAGRLDDPRQPDLLQQGIIRFLANTGFDTSTLEGSTEPGALGRRNGCRLIVLEARAQGWNSSWLRTLAEKDDDRFFVRDGDITEQQPVWQTAVKYQFARFLAALGWPAAWYPTLYVVAAPSCNARQLPWAGLATPSAR